MSASVPEPPALVRSPEEGQHGSHEPEHVLAQLSAALENPDIKALEVKGDATLNVGVGMSTGFFPGCLVQEQGVPMRIKIWGGGMGKAPFCRGWMSLGLRLLQKQKA